MQGSIRQQRGESVGLKFKVADKLVFSKLKAALGLDRCRICLNGASALPRSVFEFFLSVNIPVYDFYGTDSISIIFVVAVAVKGWLCTSYYSFLYFYDSFLIYSIACATGLAESCGPHVVSVPGTLRAGSCGKTYNGTQIRLITGSNEVILFGRNVFMGYLNDAALTAEAVDDRGWLHTFDFPLLNHVISLL